MAEYGLNELAKQNLGITKKTRETDWWTARCNKSKKRCCASPSLFT